MVLMIIAVLGALIVPLVGGVSVNEKSPQQIGTEATMNQIRDVIMGTPGRPGVWADVGHRPEFFPRSVSDLFSTNPPYSGLAAFNPSTGIG